MILPRHRPSRRLLALLGALFLSLAVTSTVVGAGAAQAAPTTPKPKPVGSLSVARANGVKATPAAGVAAPMQLGLAGPYTPASVVAGRAAGVTVGLVEAQWNLAEPAPGVFDHAYLASLQFAVTTMRAQGLSVTLNVGLHNAPAWLLAMPGAQYVDQFGQAYSGAPLPNLVFGTSLRTYAQQYENTLFALLGADVSLVRVGGGTSGELSYPYTFTSGNLVANRYFAFDANAAATNPVPGWRPGMASPAGQATTFLNWYLDALVRYQNWQISSLRTAGYTGQVAVLYPSYGMRPGDFAGAVATNLSGTSSPEINGEVQRGYDFARQVNALTDPAAVVYGTWAENLPVVTYLAGLAHAKGLAVMAENGGPNPPAVLAATLRNAVANHLQAFFLIRATDMTCGCNGWAQLADIGPVFKAVSATGS